MIETLVAAAAFPDDPDDDSASAYTVSPNPGLPKDVADITLLVLPHPDGLGIRLTLCCNGNTTIREQRLWHGGGPPPAYVFQLAIPIHRSSTSRPGH